MVRRACERGVDALEANLLSFADDPFDVVLFPRSLHHLHPLEQAMDRAHDLVFPGGTVLVEEFGLDLVDSQGAYWRYAVELFLNSIGVLTTELDMPSVPRDSLRRWREDHREHDHPISDSGTLRNALATCFAIEHEESAPYLYRYILDNLETSKRGMEMGEHVLDWERGLIAGGMASVGIRWVARR
jgi:SAM-dependent methyltransferase